jgi:hypothetical protein
MKKDDEVVKQYYHQSSYAVPEFGNLFHRFKRTMPFLGRSELRSACSLWRFILKTSYPM